ncbi:hypothetical protein [Methylobacterium sp. PvR107]|uniref:hypothetical protein n=1 Tax=Methylobacterium sp. PvR107 TaxID=2806597 RepID=UPI001AE2F7C3|nr:hypothetical protein [Methylobacterium sp. PvR107]MBP1179942.1 hypothetical protein [Methylobacterium sp. PvR107]
MSEGHDPILEAIEALKLRGHTVDPWGDDHLLWLVDGQSLTEGELLALAVRLGLMDSTSAKLQ